MRLPCAICGKPIDYELTTWTDPKDGKVKPHPMRFEVDEIIPVALGGSPFEWSNLQPAHRKCNQSKGKLTMAQQSVGNDPSAKSMQFMSVWMMPIMMFFICNSLSSGLSYYYLLSQLIAIIETFVIRKWIVNPDAVRAKVEASKGKPLPKSKWQQRLEEAQKLQEQQMKNRNRR